MARKNSIGNTCRRDNDLRFGASLIAVLVAIVLLSASAMAAAQMATDPCDSALVNEKEAREIANSAMRELGWIRTRSTALVGTRFHIRDANCANGQWQVNVVLSQGLSRSRDAVVLINCHSGEIEVTRRSA